MENIGLLNKLGIGKYLKKVKEYVDENKPYIKTTYDNLVNLRNNSQLIPGASYRITDYITTTSQENTTSAGHQFDIIVTALDESTLSEEAKAIQHDSDTYFNTANLSAWQLWYCLDNDDARFIWADTTNGKGVIYRMIDEFNNDCPYDFKNILFLRDVFTSGDGLAPAQTEQETESKHCYTFGYEQEDGSMLDATVDGNVDATNIYENIIKTYFKYDGDKSVTQQYLNNIVFLCTYKSYQENGEIICKNNSFGNYCSNISFGNYCYSNSFGDDCRDNSFGNECYSNSFGNYCSNISFGNYCYSNSFGEGCRNISFGNYCDNNSFGNYCDNNSFGESCNNNSFGESCNNNSFGNDCSSNSFGNNCRDNSFGNDCSSNSFGESCNNNSFGNDCCNISFGDYCNNNSFGNVCYYNSFGESCHSNSFEFGCNGNSFGNECLNNSFGNDCNDNSFGNDCNDNSFGESCHSNSFGESCHSNSFENDCYSNFFIGNCYRNTFGYESFNNSFGSECFSNSFGYGCSNNSFGNNCNNNSFGNDCESNSFGNDCESNSFRNNCFGNSFGNDCYENSFGNSCSYNSFGGGCYSNSFRDGCHNNSFGNKCYSNSFEPNCNDNSFGNSCYSNSFGGAFGGGCYDNSFGDGCRNNSFGESCYSNSFGNSCYSNSFEKSCSSNSFGNHCGNNSFGNFCASNSFGNSCYSNSFGESCGNNSFGNYCNRNSFRISAYASSSLKSYCQYNHFDDGCSYNILWNSDTTSPLFTLQNINVNRGVQGSSNDYNFINVQTLNSNQEINITQDDNGIYTDEIVRIEYDKLKTLRDNSQLMPGATYRIIDYVTKTAQENTTSAGHQFDIIVTALDESTLSEEAKAIQHDGDTYFTNSNLNKWQLWYCLDNDDTRFGWASDVIQVTKEISVHDSSQCTIQSNLVNENSFITPFNFESCVWVDDNGDGDSVEYDGDSNHDINELIYEWGYFTDENDNTQLCLYKSDAELYEEEGQPDYGDKYLYRGIITVDGTDYDYWQKWDEDYEGINITDFGDHVYATTPRIVSNPEAYTVTTQNIKVEEPSNQKGVIYHMIDEFNNDCPYDFKNILFLRDVFTNGDGLAPAQTEQETEIKPCYTFGYEQEDGSMLDITVNATIDATTMVVNIYDNIIKAYFEINEENYTLKQCLNNIVFLNIYKYSQLGEIICNSNSFELMCYNNSFGGGCYNNHFKLGCYNNSFGYSCDNNFFGDMCFNNSFGDNCYNNSFGGSCSSNSFGNHCGNNSFGGGCSYNSFVEYCQDNSFGESCYDNSFIDQSYSNSFGDNCYSNSFGGSCSSNSFGSNCRSNSFGQQCHSNSFGNNCYNNSFGNVCWYNSFGTVCSYNSFGNGCDYNSFGGGCSYNSFGDECTHNSFGDNCKYNSFRINADQESNLKSYCNYNHFDDGCSYNILWNSDTTSSNFCLQNINVNRGVSGTSNSYNIIHIDVLNHDYELKIAKNSKGEIKIYCEADLIA